MKIITNKTDKNGILVQALYNGVDVIWEYTDSIKRAEWHIEEINGVAYFNDDAALDELIKLNTEYEEV